MQNERKMKRTLLLLIAALCTHDYGFGQIDWEGFLAGQLAEGSVRESANRRGFRLVRPARRKTPVLSGMAEQFTMGNSQFTIIPFMSSVTLSGASEMRSRKVPTCRNITGPIRAE